MFRSLGLLKTRGRINIRGDLNLMIRQMRGEVDCKAPGRQVLRHKTMKKLRPLPVHKFLNMKRDRKQRTDRLRNKALQQ